jgi:hypothetical protein
VGLAAWQADGDLVRAAARLNLLYVPAASRYFPFYARAALGPLRRLTSGFRLRLARRRRSNEKVPLTWKNRTCLGTYQPRVEGTFPVKNSARTARVMVSADGRGLVSQAGAVLLWETMRVTGLGRGLSTGLDRWRAPRATSPPHEELSRNSVHLDEAGPRPRGTSSQGRLNELTECQT